MSFSEHVVHRIDSGWRMIDAMADSLGRAYWMEEAGKRGWGQGSFSRVLRDRCSTVLLHPRNVAGCSHLDRLAPRTPSGVLIGGVQDRPSTT